MSGPPARFPEDIPEGVSALPAQDPERMVAYAPMSADDLILIYSHALDLELCHRLPRHVPDQIAHHLSDWRACAWQASTTDCDWCGGRCLAP
ncbi:hypothetical protein SAMN04487859_12319 [Roseovarius lutimaris]|uniref:Uncharacterized protein n=1 Tax=Roseovarius lutimaris TaxID=1005928 RepID=A0A1I5FYX4_9RHOB|nr:hypothetical protein SAMN04487859_12319 [Roseovarius lutimaris]